jgi:hypothetical protein
MATRTISLDQVRIAEPCPKTWDALVGDDHSRYCAHCDRHVHNLSALSADEAQRLICASAGRLCIAYIPNEAGRVTTLEYAKPKRPRYGWRLVAALGGFGALASGLVAAVYRPKPTPPPMMLGGMMAPITSCDVAMPGPGAP